MIVQPSSRISSQDFGFLLGELWRLGWTHDWQGFIDGLNYQEKCKELTATLETPEARKKIAEYTNELLGAPLNRR